MKTVIAALMAATLATGAGADITLDDFTNSFAAEEFVFSASGGVINGTGMRAGLEVGLLGLTNGASVGDAYTQTPRATERQLQNGLSGVFGGSRDAVLNAADPDNLGSDVSVVAYSFEGNSGLSFSTAFGTQGILDLTYDAMGSGLGLDASAPGGAINIALLGGDLDNGFNPRPVPMTVTLTSGLGTAEQASFSSTLDLLVEGLNLYDLADYADAGVDLTDLDVVNINIDQSDPILAAADFAIGPIEILGAEIPAPGSIALLGLGLAATARRRR